MVADQPQYLFDISEVRPHVDGRMSVLLEVVENPGREQHAWAGHRRVTSHLPIVFFAKMGIPVSAGGS